MPAILGEGENTFIKEISLLTAYVDSIQGGSARVVIGEDAVAVAISLRDLPPGTREGMVLAVRFNIDMGATQARKARGDKPTAD